MALSPALRLLPVGGRGGCGGLHPGLGDELPGCNRHRSVPRQRPWHLLLANDKGTSGVEPEPEQHIAEALSRTGHTGLQLLAFTAAPGSASQDGLQLLATWAATAQLEADAADVGEDLNHQ